KRGPRQVRVGEILPEESLAGVVRSAEVAGGGGPSLQRHGAAQGQGGRQPAGRPPHDRSDGRAPERATPSSPPRPPQARHPPPRDRSPWGRWSSRRTSRL